MSSASNRSIVLRPSPWLIVVGLAFFVIGAAGGWMAQENNGLFLAMWWSSGLFLLIMRRNQRLVIAGDTISFFNNFGRLKLQVKIDEVDAFTFDRECCYLQVGLTHIHLEGISGLEVLASVLREHGIKVEWDI